MGYSIKEKIRKLLDEVSNIEVVKAIGQTGDINYIPKAGEADIDIFVLGEKVPSYEERKAVYDRNNILFEECHMKVCEGGVWGTGDVFIIDGVETMLMYFSIDETLKYINDILEGKYLDSSKGFYPIGRCATLKNINVIYDGMGVLSTLKEKLSIYPDKLRKEMINFQIRKINDEEGFGRALLKKDGFVVEHDGNNYMIFFPENKALVWEKYISKHLELEYWNEYITDNSVIFLFHLQDGIKRYEVYNYKNDEVLALCEKLCECRFESIKAMLVGNHFYKDKIN